MKLPPVSLTVILLSALAAAPALPALAAGGLEEAAPEGEAKAPALPAITVASVAVMPLVDRIYAGGLVQAVEEVQVAPLIEGQPIEALLADVGDRVKAGQVLARLSRTTLDLSRSQLVAQVASAKATVAQAEAQVLEATASADEANRVATRTGTLRDNGNASQAAADQAQAAAISATARVTVARQSLEAARAQAASAEAQLANVELNLTRTEVVAPVAGEVVARNAQVGAIASAAAQPMFTLIRDGALELRAEVAEADLPRLTAGQGAQVVGVGTVQPITGTVRLVEPSVDATSRLGHVRVALDQAGALRAGMFADAEIILAERMALAVPITAISAGADGATVMRVRDGVAEQVVVQTGIRDRGMVEITAGLTGGDQVVAKAGAFVRSGDRIRPVAAETN